MDWMPGVLVVASITFLISGCTHSPPGSPASVRLADIKRGGMELEQSIDKLEERFLGNQSRIGLWQELADRHQQVSAVACENAANHLEGMSRLQGQQRMKVGRKGRKTYAQVSNAIGTAHVQGRN